MAAVHKGGWGTSLPRDVPKRNFVNLLGDCLESSLLKTGSKFSGCSAPAYPRHNCGLFKVVHPGAQYIVRFQSSIIAFEWAKVVLELYPTTRL